MRVLVQHCAGRVRYWQNECESNNPIYLPGTKEEFTAQLKVFSGAVNDADPNAVGVEGGSGDPYTIEARVGIIRQKMRALGCEKPILSTE